MKNCGKDGPCRSPLLWFKFLLMAITSLPLIFAVMDVIAFPHADGPGWLWWFVFGVLFVCAVAGFVFRLGSVVPSSVFGTFWGIALDLHVKGGSIESQMWETVRSVSVGFIAGVVVGVLLDRQAQSTERSNA